MTAFHGTILSDTIIGASGNDFIAGHALGGTPSGPNGNDSLAGGAGHDTLIGAAGDDTLQGGAGNDSLDGGAGVDSAIYSGARNDYIIAYDAATDNLTIRDRRAGAPDGTDIIRNVDTLQFADGAQSAQELKSLALGGEFLVNTTTNAQQSESDVTALGAGDFVVTWTVYSQSGADISSAAIRGQVFNADGSKRGGEILVSGTTTNAFQVDSAVAALGDGGFVATWSNLSGSDGDSSYGAVRGQIFNADGSKRGGEFLVKTIDSQGYSAVAGLGDGRFVVTWADFSQSGGDTSDRAVRGQIFDADGGKRGGEFLVNSMAAHWYEKYSAVTALGDGRFVVTCSDHGRIGGDMSDAAVRGQIYNDDGSPRGGEFLVNTTTYGGQIDSAVAALGGGRFVVTWTDQRRGQKGNGGLAVRGQIFNADGGKRGGEFLVNTTTATSSGGQGYSAVTALNDDRFVVTWTDDIIYMVRGQVFNADGSKSNGEFLVSSSKTEHDQAFSAITALSEGRFVITWVDAEYGDGGDSWSSAVRGRIFSLDFPGNDYFSGGVGADSLSGFAGDDTLFGAAGNDSLSGGTGNDSLDGAAGDDRLDGGTGVDRLAGGLGNDSYVVDDAGDVVVEDAGAGIDLVQSSLSHILGANVENLTLLGTAALNGTGNELNNVIAGNTGANSLSGADGNDYLLGGAGNDSLDGGAGDDRLDGGTGADRLAGGPQWHGQRAQQCHCRQYRGQFALGRRR
jgi:hypothetical protein